MSQQENQHKSAKLKYQNKAVNVRLPTHDATPQLRLDAITRKIKNRFKLDTKQYKLSFNNAFIDLDDPNQLDQIFLNNKPEITFVVTKNVRKFASQSKNCFNFIVIYDENHAMKYPFPLDLEQWNDDMLSNLMSETKDKFQIKTEFLLCEDKKMEFEIDDIEDLKTAVEEGTHDKNKQFNSEFTFDLFIKIEQQSNDNVPDVYINNNDKQLVDNAPDVYINNQNKSPQQQQHIQKHNNNNQSDIYVNNQNKPPQQQQQQHIQKDNNNNPANVYINDEIKINIEEKKIDDNKLMSECFSGKFNDIMQFHQKMFKRIFNQFRCYINKSNIDSELFQNVIDCLNKIKPSEYDQNDYLLSGNIKTKILFWKKYAYLCLMTHNVQKCISLKIAIKPELIETDQFNHDLFTQQYAKLVDIINKYHSLREQDKQLKFDNLLIECSKIEIKDVPVDMMPVDDQLDDDMKKFISSQQGSSVVISPKNQYQRNRKRDNASVRIYLLSPYESTRAYVLLPEITEEWCELKFVSRNNKHLLYLDLCVPMFSFETKIQFKCQTNSTGYITINPRWKLRKNKYVFYWVEDSRSGARKMWDYFSSKIWNAKDEKVRAGQLIFKQLLDGITDFKSFCKSQIILKGLKDRISPRDLDKIWKREIVNMVKQHKVIHVFRMQLIMVLEGYALTTDELYHIIKTFYLDSQISFKKRNYQLKQELGMTIYESFIESVENQFQQHRLRNVDSTNYLLLHSIYHFFKYFENLKYRNQRSKRNRSNIQFHYYHKGNNYFKKDTTWQTMETMDMMKMDLDIAFAFNTKRQYPFEHIALCLAQSQQQNGEELFKNIINTISIRNKQESEMLIQEVFKNSHPQLFEILNNNFNLWMFVITKISSVKMDLIVTNQQVLNSFRMNLNKQINRMSFSNNKLTELHKIIGKMPKIFATVNIHLCLLRNIKLVEMGNNNNKLQMQRNLKNILGITLRQQHIDDAVVSELIIFIAIIFQDKYSRNIALSVISKVFLASNNTKLRRIFKEALHKTISQKHNIADRIAMFLECNAFYSEDLVSIYEYFIEIIMQGNGKNINVWNNYQMNNIKNMVNKSTKGRNENAIKIWNGIFDKLIKLPISAKNKQEIKPIIYERKQSMYSDSDMDTDNDDKEDAKDDEIDMYDDSELINNLKYCFSMIKWISFAMEKREIRPLNMLIEFIEIQLKQLNSRIISKEINMECLELLNENNIKKLVKDCEYNRHFNIKKMDEMIKQLLIWNKFSQQFRIFLTKYTKPGDKIELETKTFLQILKNWGAHKYINIEKRQEWNEWIYPNNKKLEVICNLQQSQVFFYIWFSNRDILVNQIWNLDSYLNILYVNCGKQWDNLVQRCHKLQLTFKDKKYFEDVHLMQELHIMKLKDKTAKQIEKDMRDSLKLDRYVTFVQNLIQIVQVFIEFGNTNIEKPNDKHWRQLNENLNTANYKRNDETQNISEAAELYRNINGAVKQQYKDINIQWIKAVVKCKETVKKLANDEEYDRNRFTDTLKIIDDFSTDGQMIQLSGSLRSVYKQFTCIWEQIFNTKLDLMRYFAIIKLKPNDINNLLDVHQNETKIKQIISDAGKMAQQRDMDKLDLAISTGFFEFSQQKVIQKYINQFDESETNVIAANGFKLCFKSDQKSDDILSYDEMNCDEIQNKIDIILLCRRNSDTDTQDEEKKIEFEEEDNDKQNVTEYIKKLEICKEISELRVQYIINGGRMSYNDKLLPAKCDLSHFNDIQNEWKTRLKNWNKYVDEMRYNSHLLNYFTVNKIRIIIEQLNTYKNVKQPLLFEQLLSHFRFIKSELTAKELKQIVQKWKNIDANSKDSLEYFNKCFSNEIILSIYDKKNNKQKNANYNLITNGQPNVMIVKSEKSAIFATLKLYYNSNTIPIPVNQILICNSGTTLEEIEIFIFRCLDNEKRFEYTDSSSIPLYTLLFPEHLNMSISDKAIEIFDKYLLGKNQKTQRYSFVVISCVEINNPICNALGPYKVHDVSSTFTDNDAKNISNILFNGNDDSILQVNKLFVQLYYSERVGTGKSFIIQQKCNVINNNNINNNNLIRIPINSSNINLDFIVDRLYECYGNKRKKIIYHIDISSSASDTINILLFNLLFLRYISTKHSCFSISNKMAFLIELPTNLASLKTKTHKVKDEFYLLHAPIKLTRKHINLNTNPFQYNDNCHYAAKFLQHFHADDLKKNDPDPIHQKVKDNEIQQIMTKFPNEIYLSPIHQYSFWQYLFTQFQQVVHSNLIKNQWYADQDERQLFKHWKHLVTESIIDLAPDFSKKLYNDDQKYDNDDESTGTESFHLTQKWQNQDKPIVLLNQSIDGSISFLVSDINKMDKALKAALDTIKCPLLGWMQQDQNESKQHKIQLLLKILGTSDEMVLFQLLSAKPYCDYALTYDNMLKMIAIFFRIKANIPVILMGETGCGKTCLLNYLAKAANKEIERADVHGGFIYTQIRKKMTKWINKANKKLKQSDEMLQLKLLQYCGDMKQGDDKDRVEYEITKQHEMQQSSDLWIFLDEINTSPDIGYFKEILCDGHFDGKPLPRNMRVIAACNPYRKRKIKHLSKSIINDPLAQYMYRVYPLPSTMKEYVWMFGSLSNRDEKAYCYQMCDTFTKPVLNGRNKQAQQTQLSEAIVISQQFVRKILKDSAFVSLRDIARCLKIFVYSYKRSNNFNESMIESLALVYYFRLKDKQRIRYNKMLSQNGVRRFWSTLEGKNGVIDKICDLFTQVIPKGVALNRSLRENIFLLFICIQTKTPLILVGKPGSSKTLAMSIVKNYLADKAGKDAELLKRLNLSPIHVISFQCSTQSKAVGIKERWKQTEQFAKENKDLIAVLLLDEIGLAEHSQHRPLKILHQLLEIDPAPIAFIGLSNWALDAAKMNRAVMHLCPKHKISDLTKTARAMAKQYLDKKRVNKVDTKLKVLSYVYKDITALNNKLQPRVDFFGARDFYAVVRHFLMNINQRNNDINQSDDEQLIMYLLRNFGGINYQNNDDSYYQNDIHNSMRDELFKIITKHMAAVKNNTILEDTVDKYPPARLIQLNLTDRRSTHNFEDTLIIDNFIISRHVLVITQHENSWNALIDLNIINHDSIFIFGSEFERDKSNNIYLHLNKVKNCMETGQTLVLCNLEEIHESLYDMLNQRYTLYKHSGKMYCRIALGSNSQSCFVDPQFKVLVIATKKDAHNIASNNAVPIAFLNRFEKQLISYHSSLSTNNLRFLYKLKGEICDRYCLANMIKFKHTFPGFCSDTFASLILNIMNIEQNKVMDDDRKINYDDEDEDDDDYYMDEYKGNNILEKPEIKNEDMMKKCCDMLLDVTLTESLIQSTVNNKNNRRKHFLTEYIPTLQQLIENNNIESTKLLIILTFDFESQLDKDADYFNEIQFKKMSEFSKVDQFEKYLYKYLNGNHGNNNLLLQYRHSDINHFIHIKHTIESKIYRWNKTNRNIILLVHLHRNENLYKEFPLIFCKSAKLVFLDSLSQKQPIRLDSFTNFSIKDVCKQRGIELLQKTFYIALSHLHFSKKINVKNEIKKLDYLLSNNNKDSPIQKLIFDRFLKLLSSNKINRNIGEIVCKSISKNQGWIRGSFYERLNNFIDSIGVIGMIRILQTLYTNYNIDILQTNNVDDNNSVFNLFVLLYSQFDLIEDNNMLDVNIEQILDERPNKLFVKNDYHSSFPFSDKIHFWCNSQKTKIQTLIAQNNEMKNEFEEKQDEKDMFGDNDNDNDIKMDIEWVKLKLNVNQSQIDIGDRLRGEMESVWPSFVCELSMNMAELYAKDLILLNGHKLQINQSFPNDIIDLGAKILIIATQYFNNKEFDFDQENMNTESKITIAELETMMWNKLEFVKHVIATCNILTTNEMIEISTGNNQSLTLIIDRILENILNSLNAQIYENYNMYSILNSIKYIIHQFDNKNADDIMPLFSKYNMMRIQLIALKNDLIELDINELYQILNNKVSLLDYNTLCESFELLCKSIKTEFPKEKLCNQILYDLLSLIDDTNVNECDEASILGYAQFLIDILCKLDLIIDLENAQTIKWNKNTENEIVRKLFAVLSLETFKSDEIIEQIQNTNKELAGLIIQVMSRDKNDNKICKTIKYAKSQRDFDEKLNIVTPLIEQFNKDIHTQVINAVNIKQ